MYWYYIMCFSEDEELKHHKNHALALNAKKHKCRTFLIRFSHSSVCIIHSYNIFVVVCCCLFLFKEIFQGLNLLSLCFVGGKTGKSLNLIIFLAEFLVSIFTVFSNWINYWQIYVGCRNKKVCNVTTLEMNIKKVYI